MEKNYAQMLIEILQNTEDSIYCKDLNGKFTLVSETKARNSGMTWEEMIGKTDFDFMLLEEAESAWLDDVAVMTTGIPIRDKVKEITRKDGSKVWVSESKTPRRDPEEKIIGMLGISRDITRRVQIERHNINMLSTATHEIQQPLASLSSNVKLILRGSYGSFDDSVRATLEDIDNRIWILRDTVSEYLSVSSLIVNEKIPEKQELDLRVDIIDPALDKFSREIEEKGIKIDNRLKSIPAGKIKFKAVRSWMNMAISELLNNAIRYGGDKIRPVIAFGYEDYPDKTHIIVYDNGPAILEEYREAIFNQYTKLDSTKSKSFGLGLYIIREVIRKHGGDVWYEPTLENHSKFILMIPK